MIYKGWRLFAPTLVDGGPEIESDRHTASGVRVVVNDGGNSEVSLPIRHDLRRHSSQFNWGYGGSGPAQLALAICCHALGDDVGRQPAVYQRFKCHFVSKWEDEWQITADEVREWLQIHYD